MAFPRVLFAPKMLFALAILPAAILGGCASTEPPKLQNNSGTAAPPMHQEEIGGRPTAVYRSPNADFRKYTRFIVEPVEIYQGSDAQFGDSTEPDKKLMAQFMQTEFRRALGSQLATAPGRGVARIQLTLGGLEDNVPVVSTVAHLAPAGLLVNVINSATDKPGSFTGSATIAGTISDSRTRVILVSFVQKRYPDAMDLPATLSSRDAQKAAISAAADGLRKRIDAARSGRN